MKRNHNNTLHDASLTSFIQSNKLRTWKVQSEKLTLYIFECTDRYLVLPEKLSPTTLYMCKDIQDAFNWARHKVKVG